MSYMFSVIIVQLLLLVAGCCDDRVKMPPSIAVHPLKDKIYRVDDDATLECVAHGVPTPRYEWHKNGLVLDPLPNLIFLGNGTIHLSPLTTLDEGYYQCYAFNDYGTTMSSVAVLRRAVITSNPPMDPKEYKVTEGRSLMLRCQQSKCYPRPRYAWSVFSHSGSETLIRRNSRIQIDEQVLTPIYCGMPVLFMESGQLILNGTFNNRTILSSLYCAVAFRCVNNANCQTGNLHFAYLNQSDSYNGLTYKCQTKNIWLDVEYGGSYAKLNISQDLSDESEQQFGPVYAFSSPAQVTGLLGGNITLRCFFYGRPIPNIRWSRENESELLADKFVLSNYNTEMLIMNLSLADETVYRCSASNDDVTVLRSITLKVEVVPMFQSAISQPYNVNVTESNSVSFFCRTHAKPQATVTWFRNGVEINAGALPPRYSLNSDGTELTISELCRECPDGSSDLQVIQCNASNQHGYAFSAGYVNVLKKTAIETNPPYLFIEVIKRAFAKFTCTATSDPSTPVIIHWYRVHEGAMTRIISTGVNEEGVSVDGNHSLIFRSNPGSMKWYEYLGVYRCQADNGYSNDSSEIKLNALDILSTFNKQDFTTSAVVTEVTTEEFAQAGTVLYWIVMLVVLLVVVIIIIIFIKMCCCHGDTYNVDEKEHKDNKDPEKELKDNDLTEYQRPEGKVSTLGSHASLVTSASHDEEPNEFGDGDDTMFLETGSFIGQYVQKQS